MPKDPGKTNAIPTTTNTSSATSHTIVARIQPLCALILQLYLIHSLNNKIYQL